MRPLNAFSIIGPIMIGPSSSHTAGAVRLGRLTRAILGGIPERAEIELHGSFAKTYRGHGTDLALVAGLLGLETDDPKIRSSLTIAAESGMEVRITTADLGNCHPNTARITVCDREGKQRVVEGSSIGGGSVIVTRIDDYEVELTGDYLTLVIAHQDEPGKVARVTTILAGEAVNIAGMRVSREKRGAGALMVIELDDRAPDRALTSIRAIPGVQSVVEVEAVRL